MPFISYQHFPELHYWGTYRTKYLLEAEGNWPETKIVQAETLMEAMCELLIFF